MLEYLYIFFLITVGGRDKDFGGIFFLFLEVTFCLGLGLDNDPPDRNVKQQVRPEGPSTEMDLDDNNIMNPLCRFLPKF